MKIIKLSLAAIVLTSSLYAVPAHKVELNLSSEAADGYVEVSASTGVWSNNHCDLSGIQAWFRVWLPEEVSSQFPNALSFDIDSEDLDGLLKFPSPNGKTNCFSLSLEYNGQLFVDEFMYDSSTQKSIPSAYYG